VRHHARGGNALDRDDDVVHASVDDEARELDREMTRTRMHLLQRIQRGIDDGGYVGLPERLQVGDGLSAQVYVDELRDRLHERGSGAAGVTQQLRRGGGGFAHELVFAIQEQHAGLRQLEHRVRLRARHHELLVARAQAAALCDRIQRDADEADQRRTQGHDGKIEEFHGRQVVAAPAATNVSGSTMALSPMDWVICSIALSSSSQDAMRCSRDFAMRRSSSG
jgi:hypothetical protein